MTNQPDDLVERLGDEADLCRNDEANDIADLLDEAAATIKELKAEAERLTTPFAWVQKIEWHKPAHRAVMASVKLGSWLSAALDDPKVCEEMKTDIREWFSAGEPMETLGQALEAAEARAAKAEEALRKIRYEAERENGGWVHLKRAIAAQCREVLGSEKTN